MLKLITFPLVILTLFLTTGCAKYVPNAVVEEPSVCDVEQMRKFSQTELDWRAEYAPWNLALDFKTNKTLERECAEKLKEAG